MPPPAAALPPSTAFPNGMLQLKRMAPNTPARPAKSPRSPGPTSELYNDASGDPQPSSRPGGDSADSQKSKPSTAPSRSDGSLPSQAGNPEYRVNQLTDSNSRIIEEKNRVLDENRAMKQELKMWQGEYKNAADTIYDMAQENERLRGALKRQEEVQHTTTTSDKASQKPYRIARKSLAFFSPSRSLPTTGYPNPLLQPPSGSSTLETPGVEELEKGDHDILPTLPTTTPRPHPAHRTHRNSPPSQTPSINMGSGVANGKTSHSSPLATTSYYPWPPAPIKAPLQHRRNYPSHSTGTATPSSRPSCPPTSTWTTSST